MKLKLMVILMLIWPLGLSAADQIALKLNLQPGASYTYTMDINQTRSQTVENEKQSLSQEMLQVWGFDVIDRQKNGDMDINLTYKRIKVTQNFDNQSNEFDTDNPPATLDPSMKSMAAMPGTVLTVRMSASGKVIKLDGLDALINKMIKVLDLPDSEQKKPVIDDLRKQWGSDAMKQSLEQITSFYPDKLISMGETWTTAFNLTSGGLPMQITSQYTLQSRNNGVDSLDVSSTIGSDSTSSAVKMGSLTMIYKINGSQNGTILAEEDSGLPSYSKLDMHYDGMVTVSGVPNQESKTWPVSATGTAIITFGQQ